MPPKRETRTKRASWCPGKSYTFLLTHLPTLWNVVMCYQFNTLDHNESLSRKEKSQNAF